MARTRKQYPEDLRTKTGVSLMWLSQVVAGGFITSYLMLYLTDYAGLYQGVPGGAAVAATTMLLIGRIWDAVNDPLLGFIMDRSPRTRWGRFKPYIVVAIPLSAFFIIMLFNVPAGFGDGAKLLWIYLFYFLFDTAMTALPFNPLTQSLTTDTTIRGKLVGLPRVVSLIASMGMSSFIAVAIALGPDGMTPAMGKAMAVFMVPLALLSFIGVLLVREGTANADEPMVKVSDLLSVVKVNKPLWVAMLSALIGGFSWTFTFGGSNYYIKYALGVENFGLTSLLLGMGMILSLIIGVFVSQRMVRTMTPGLATMVSWFTAAAPLALLFLINLAGPITSIPVLFSILFIAMLGIGMGYVPGGLVLMECMDYNKVSVGKSMEGSLNAVSQMIQKLQAAISAVAVGAVLIAIGYDAGKYEDATAIPPELFSGLGVVIFGLPALLAALGGAVFFLYPLLKHTQRDVLLAALPTRHEVPDPR